MTEHPPQFKSVSNLKDLQAIVEQSKFKPALVFKYQSDAQESLQKKEELEKTWDIFNDIDLYLVDDNSTPEVSKEIAEMAEIDNEFPQIILFADGVTMYDETGDFISVKKVQLALKIVNRTFKWSETRA